MACTHYAFDAKSSQFTVQAFAEGLAGIADHRPRFSVRDFFGELLFDKDNLNGGSLHLSAKIRSLEIMDEVSKHDRQSIERVMFGEILHPEVFPEVRFTSSRVVCGAVEENRYRTDIGGTVSLHGVEQPQLIQAQLILSEGSLRAYGEFRLRQTDYGLSIASVAGGIVRIKDELKFVFFVVAREQKRTETATAGA
jgi:polyisoprenoid-binding protein YceI